MKRFLSVTLCLAMLGLANVGLATVCLGQRALGAEDPTGTWKWTMERNNQKREVTLTLKLEGDKLSGEISGRDNTKTAIDDAKFADGEVSFSVTREFNGTKRTSKYKGKVSGDTITGTRESQRDGKPVTTEWVAKKSTT